MLDNRVFIPFDVTSLSILRKDRRVIPTGNQNYIYAQFTFSSDWDGLNKTAVFKKDGIEPRNTMIYDDICQIPNEFTEDVGTIEISVFAGDRRTVNTATIEVIKSGFIEASPVFPPNPSSMHVQTPDSTVPYVGYDGDFWFEADGEKKRVADIDPTILSRIIALESDNSALWMNINAYGNRIRSLETRIDALEGRI